jgi:hypothetical protein
LRIIETRLGTLQRVTPAVGANVDRFTFGGNISETGTTPMLLI